MNNTINNSAYPPEANTAIANKYHKLSQEIRDMMLNWKNLIKLSDILCKGAKILIIISFISAIIYGIILHKIWYMILLNVIVAIAGAVLLSGVVILLFKPLLWFLRYLALKKHSKLVEKENELCALETIFVDQNSTEEPPKVTKEMYLANKNKIKYKTLLRKYKENLQETTKTKNNLRLSKLSEQASREWDWIQMALGVVGIAISIILWLIALYLLIVFLCAVAVIAAGVVWVNSSRGDFYYSSKYDPPDPNDVPKAKEYKFRNISKKDYANGGIIEKLDMVEKRYERLMDEHNDLLNLLTLCVPEMKLLYR